MIVETDNDFYLANKNWLDKFQHNDFEERKEMYHPRRDHWQPSWWNGINKTWGALGVTYGFTVHPYNESFLTVYGKDILMYSWVSYFKNWKRPSKEEQNYLEMVEGFRLPWSEENCYYAFGDEYFEGNM
jgi:hypothetical protein